MEQCPTNERGARDIVSNRTGGGLVERYLGKLRATRSTPRHNLINPRFIGPWGDSKRRT